MTDDLQLMEHDRARKAGVVSFLSSNEREGRWPLPRLFRALAVLGNVELDLRDAEIGYGLSVIEAVAVLGNVEIKVPPDVAVDCDGDSFMGSFTVKYEGRASPAMANRERMLRVTGSAYAGAVTVMVKGPDEDFFARIKSGWRRDKLPRA
jgi:Cell wall-active antibiotics response 4TMS YvqF